MTLVCNSLFTRDGNGALQMTTSAPIFAEARRRTETNSHGEFQEGVYPMRPLPSPILPQAFLYILPCRMFILLPCHNSCYLA